MNPSQAVWITGIGTCTPLGTSYAEVARNLMEGRSGIGRVTTFPVQDHPSQIAGQVIEVPLPPEADPVAFRALFRLEQVMHWCVRQALDDAGLWAERKSLRIGLALGVGAECMLGWEADGLACQVEGWCPPTWEKTVVERTRLAMGLNGPAVAVSAACASGNIALAQARTWLRLGWVDVCVAGACDMAVSPMSLAAFGNLRALSRRNNDPTAASRPFDRGRDGFVMGEGGAVFVLESAAEAKRRGARVYADLAGYGSASDAHHLVIPSPDPAPAIEAVRIALADAGVTVAEIDYINAHATSTTVGDQAESRVLSTVLGDSVRDVYVSSTKSMTGHLVTAAAAVEALACIAAMQLSHIPPTINLDDPDPECGLRHVPNQARPKAVRVALSNSFGFGGSNTCIVLRAA